MPVRSGTARVLPEDRAQLRRGDGAPAARRVRARWSTGSRGWTESCAGSASARARRKRADGGMLVDGVVIDVTDQKTHAPRALASTKLLRHARVSSTRCSRRSTSTSTRGAIPSKGPRRSNSSRSRRRRTSRLPPSGLIALRTIGSQAMHPGRPPRQRARRSWRASAPGARGAASTASSTATGALAGCSTAGRAGASRAATSSPRASCPTSRAAQEAQDDLAAALADAQVGERRARSARAWPPSARPTPIR